jgi:hypothetical protein
MDGALAQREVLCYRSALTRSLDKLDHPWGPHAAIHTPDVIVMRSSLGSRHHPPTPDIPVTELAGVSVISIAAIRRPSVCVAPGIPTRNARTGQYQFKHAADRRHTKVKKRLVLRIAARERHELLMLGDFSCGAIRNPPEDVATVLDEEEPIGGWWREIVSSPAPFCLAVASQAIQ